LVTPKKVTVDAGKEEAATFKAIQLRFKSFSEYHAENGNDARDHDLRRAADIRHAMDIAEEAKHSILDESTNQTTLQTPTFRLHPTTTLQSATRMYH
jgi:hypothetical protein